MKLHALFGERVSALQTGVSFGDASARAPDWTTRVREAAALTRATRVTSPWLDFAHDVVHVDEMTRGESGFLVAPRPADGCVVHQPGDAVFIANGDCSIGVLWHASSGALAVMHLGLDCLWRQDGAAPLIEQAVSALDAPASELQFWVGFGIGPCCHGYRGDTEAHQRRERALRACFGDEVFPGMARLGPRAGQRAYDHKKMATIQARALGVGDVVMENRCTACDGLDDPHKPGYGTYFSNTRDHARTRERNCVMVTIS